MKNRSSTTLRRQIAAVLRDRMLADQLSVRDVAHQTRLASAAVERLLDPKDKTITRDAAGKAVAFVGYELDLTAAPARPVELDAMVRRMIKARGPGQMQALKREFLNRFYGRVVETD